MTFENKRLTGIIVAIAVLLSIPFVSMRIGFGFDWSLMDFLIVAVLLLATGLACEFVLRKVRSTGYRLAICAGILFALFVVWAELAVGLIGTPFAGS